MLLSCSSLIFVNYYTIRILSSTRAYVNGESQYSKGQKEASLHLTMYLCTKNESHWNSFNKEIKIPLGDQTARIAMTKGLDENIAKNGFRNGKNKEEDLTDLIWIFNNFQPIPFVKKAVTEWKQGDSLVNILHSTGMEIHKKIRSGNLDEKTKLDCLSKVATISSKLSINEEKFSNTFGEGSHQIKNYLIILNIFLILVIISCITTYYFMTLKKIMNYTSALNKNKEKLYEIIEDLEKTQTQLSTEIVQHKKLIGTISHDIKSPLKFLTMTSKYIYAESENCDDAKFKRSTKAAYLSTLQLYNFTDSLLTYSKIFFEDKNSEKPFYNLKELVQSKCSLFNEIAIASNNQLINEIDKDIVINTNSEVMSVILHNLIDNAIKNTENGMIKAYNYSLNNKLYLVIEDNGKGFNKEDLAYYNKLSNEQSSEKLILTKNKMGLHMVMELVNMVNGDLKIASEEGKGAKIEIITDYISN